MASTKAMSSAAACVAALLPHISARRVQRFRDVLSRRVLDTCVVLENLGDPRNCSAVVRTADALGVQTLCVIERYERWNRIDSVDKGAGKWLSVETFRTAAECADWLRQRDFALFATDLSPGALPLDAAVKASLSLSALTGSQTGALPGEAHVPVLEPEPVLLRQEQEQPRFRPRVAIALGNEHRGVSRALAAHATHCFYIPQAGFVQSMNVSVAAAIALHSFLHRTPDYGATITAGRHGGLVVHDDHEAGADAAPISDMVDGSIAVGQLKGADIAPPCVVADGKLAELTTLTGLRTEYLSQQERDELLLRMLLTSMNNGEKILERKGVRPPDL